MLMTATNSRNKEYKREDRDTDLMRDNKGGGATTHNRKNLATDDNDDDKTRKETVSDVAKQSLANEVDFATKVRSVHDFSHLSNSTNFI